jgi:Fe-S cluster assembly protein SufD
VLAVVGEVQAQQLGIPEEQARRLVVRGFFGEIISKIAVPEIRDRLTAAIEHELEITESRTTAS